MTKRKFIGFRLYTLLVWSAGVASAQPSLPSVSTPEAMSIAKYGGTSVNYHTGSISPDIPLYTIQNRELSVPIGINYSNQGMQVRELASSVGHGWSLSAGGVIVKIVNGIRSRFQHGFSHS